MAKLTEMKLRSLKSKEKDYRVSDGNGLFIIVRASGTHSWQYRFTSPISKKERIRTIGNYPKITLAQARSEHRLLYSDVKSGKDPQETLIQKRLEQPVSTETFETVCFEWLEIQKDNVSKATWDKDWSRLQRFILPILATKKLIHITAQHLLNQCTKVAKANGRETAMRTMNAVKRVLKYAVVTGKVPHNVAEGLTEYLPKSQKVSMRAILDKHDLGRYIYTVENDENKNDLVGSAIRLMPHIFVRHSEMLGMKWSEIDWLKKEWKYEVSKTKNSGVSTHIVFLTDQVIEILKNIQGITGHKDNVFHSTGKNNQLSQRATMYRVRELGFEDIDMHGFRSTARTLGCEELDYDEKYIERCLAHKTKETLGDTYDKTQYLPQRKEFYRIWSDFLFECKKNFQQKKIRRVK